MGHLRADTYFPVSQLRVPRRLPTGPFPHPAPAGGQRPKVPAVKMQRAKRVLPIMVSWCLLPSPTQAAGEFVGTDRVDRERTAPPLPRKPRGGENPGAGGEARRTQRGLR